MAVINVMHRKYLVPIELYLGFIRVPFVRNDEALTFTLNTTPKRAAYAKRYIIDNLKRSHSSVKRVCEFKY